MTYALTIDHSRRANHCPPISLLTAVELRVTGSVPGPAPRGSAKDRNEEGRVVGAAGTDRVPQSEQVLRRDVVPARHLGHDRPQRIRLRHDPALELVAPPAATSRTDLDIHPASRAAKRQLFGRPNIRTVLYVTARILSVQLTPGKVGAENRLGFTSICTDAVALRLAGKITRLK